MNVRTCRKSEIAQHLEEDWVDKTRRVFVEGDIAYIPVREGFPFDEVLAERTPYVGRGYQKMGDTILIHGDAPDDAALAELLAFEHPSCVLHSTGQTGVMRIPEIRVLYGTPHEVTFREAGISYTLDPSRVMFSQGNRGEKLRIRSLVQPGEKIADMFAGIGYFTLSAALAGGTVHAMEINPESFAFLEKNIAANYLGRKVTAECGDCREKLRGTYDRILMGHFDAIDFLPHALAHAKAGTILHVHGVGERQSEVEDAVSSAGFRYTISEYKVKKYASRTWHCVWDVKLV